MKIIKIIGHPVSVICIYLLLLISGESFGGFYFLYIILGLPHGVPDAIVSLIGVGIMLLGYKIYRSQYHPVKPALYILADAVMILGLVLFFQVTKGYNNATFRQTVPLFSFVLFGLSVLCNVLLSIMRLNQRTNGNRKHFNVAA